MNNFDKLIDQSNKVCDLYFKTGNFQEFVIAIARLQEFPVEFENSENNKDLDT